MSLATAGCGGGGDGGGVGPDAPRATSITVSPSTLVLTFLGEKAHLTASVRDQNGQPFSASGTWSGGDPAVATVSGNGDVTAVGNGTTTVNVAVGSVSASVTVTVQRVATRVTLISGDGQTGEVGTTLPLPLIVESTDAGGAAVGNVPVSFAVVAGGGSLSATSVTTGADGTASSTWTLGPQAGTQRVTVSIQGLSAGTATFSAEARPGPPVALSVVSGDDQSGPRGFALLSPVVVEAVDQFGNGVPEVDVSFSVTGGGGSVDPGIATTGPDGTAQAAWTLGAAQGPNQLTVTAPGLDAVTISATALGVADLTLPSVTLSPLFPTPDDVVIATVTVTNTGDGSTLGSFSIRVLVDGLEATRTAVAPLSAGGSVMLNVPVGPFSEGSHTVTLEVDPDELVPESNEVNNSALATVSAVAGTPIAAGTPVANLSGAAGSVTFFTIEVPGPTGAPGERPLAAAIEMGAGPQKGGGGPQAAVRHVSPVAAGSGPDPASVTTVNQLRVTLTGGSGDADLYVHYEGRPDNPTAWDCRSTGVTTTETCAFVDPVPGTYHVLVLGFEAYSGVTLTATTVLGDPDLTITSIDVTPASPTLSQTLAVDALITNVGSGPTVLDFKARLLVDGVQAASVTVDALLTGGSAQVPFTAGPLSQGAHTITVVVDPDDVIDESNEANNSSQKQVTAVDAIALTPGAPVTGLSGSAGSETFFTIEVPASSGAPARGAVASSIEAGASPQKFGSRRGAPRVVEFAPPTASSAAITRLEVALSGGSGDPDLYVAFGTRGTGGASPTGWDCASEGSSTTESCVFNDPAPGTYHILVRGFSAYSGVTLLGTATEGPLEAPFYIQLEFITHGTASQDAAFQSAADRWTQIVRSELPDIDFASFPIAADACADGTPAFSGVVDDLLIYVDITAIDGPGGTLGQAGPCVTRGGTHLPVMGAMQFDQADLAQLESGGDLAAVVLHEMGHVLGVGILWNTFGFLEDPSLPDNGGTQGADTHFTGPLAIAAFNAAGGTGYTGGEKVPVENQLGDGSGDAHWRENPVGHELMTPVLNAGQINPLSAITVQSLADMGYEVDVTQADPYSKIFAGPPRAPAHGARLIDLGRDVRTGPILVVGEQGRVMRTIKR